MPSVTITLPPPDAKLHAHNTGHWRGKSGPTKALRQMAYMITLQEMRQAQVSDAPWQHAEIRYRFFFADARRRDAANAVQSTKPAVDGVADANLIIGDHWQALQIGCVRCEIDRDNPRTELEFLRID